MGGSLRTLELLTDPVQSQPHKVFVPASIPKGSHTNE
jgi:hypothetical protein